MNITCNKMHKIASSPPPSSPKRGAGDVASTRSANNELVNGLEVTLEHVCISYRSV